MDSDGQQQLVDTKVNAESNDSTTERNSYCRRKEYSIYMWGRGISGWGFEGSPVYIKNLSEMYSIQQLSCGLQENNNTEKALLLTTRGEVKIWSTGLEDCCQNDKNWRSVGHGKRIVSETILAENVTSIVSGKSCYVALNSAGEVFAWTLETRPEDVDGNSGFSYNLFRGDFTKVEGVLSAVKVKQVSVGWGRNDTWQLAGHCIIALASTGKAYSWGRNQFGMTGLGHDEGDQEEPTLISGFEDKVVVQIASYQHHSAAITSDGLLYTWGCGENGCLGHGDELDCQVPTCVQTGDMELLKNDRFKQVACGGEHTVVMTEFGKVYAFGGNGSGQIGQGENAEAMYTTLTLVQGLDDYEVTKVACGTNSSHVVSTRRELLTWGCEGRATYHAPVLEDSFRNQRVEDLQCFGETYAALVAPRSDYVSLRKAFHSSVNNDEFSDVTFLVENELIRAHRLVVARRCNYFHKMFTSGMRESAEDTIPIRCVNKETFMTVLSYLYTEKIDIKIANVFQLYRAADMFDLPQLQDICLEAAETKVGVENAAVFLQETHDGDCKQLKEIAMKFVRHKFDKVSNTMGFDEISLELLQEVVRGFKLI